MSSVLLYESEIEILLSKSFESLLTNIDARENTTNAYLLITLLAMLRDKGEVSKFTCSRVFVLSRMWFLAGLIPYFASETFTLESSDSNGIKKNYTHCDLYFKDQG